MVEVSKLKFENGTYNIKDSVARNEINNLEQKIDTNTTQLESEINNLETHLTQSTTDVNSFVRTKQQSIPPKQGLITNSKKLIIYR